MYMTLEQARDALRKRQGDIDLRNRVARYVQQIPDYLSGGPCAVIARQLASPNMELFRFAELAASTGLPPCCAEYTGDRFHTGNSDKLLLGKMTFHHGRGRNQGTRLTVRRVIDIEGSHGLPLSQIGTFRGESFIDFHHRILKEELPSVSTFDCTAWLRKMGGHPALFWPRHLALFLCHGILFDNFHCSGSEASFTRDIIRPAFRTVKRKFGLDPLVVALVPRERERERYWSWYPGHLEHRIDQSPVEDHCRSPAPAVPGRIDLSENRRSSGYRSVLQDSPHRREQWPDFVSDP